MTVKKSKNAKWANQKGRRTRFLKSVGRMLVLAGSAIMS